MLNITYCRSDRGVGGGGIGVSAAAFAAATALLHLLIFLLFPLVFRPAVLEPHFHLKSLIGSVLRIIPYLRRIHSLRRAILGEGVGGNGGTWARVRARQCSGRSQKIADHSNGRLQRLGNFGLRSAAIDFSSHKRFGLQCIANERALCNNLI